MLQRNGVSYLNQIDTQFCDDIDSGYWHPYDSVAKSTFVNVDCLGKPHVVFDS